MFSIRRLAVSALGIRNARLKHTLPDLPYPYEALEPVISREIMNLHHCKHHQAYVTNLNLAEEKLRCALEKNDVNEVVSLQSAIIFNGGGHINHSIFWNNLSPCASEPSLELCRVIKQRFGTIEKLKEELTAAAVGVQGSGWAWLAVDPKTGCLTIKTTANQDPLQATTGLIPMFGIDVWEHAYYLQYKNVRLDYIKAIFDIVNWKDISERYKKFTGC